MRPSPRLIALLLALAAAPAQAVNPFVSHRLAIDGAVEQPQQLTVADLAELPLHRIERVPVICHTGAHIADKHHLEGVLLRDLVAHAHPEVDTPRGLRTLAVTAGASDGYQVVFSWGELFNTPIGEQVLVYFRHDGQPLDDTEGRIALISGADQQTGARHVRWLDHIEVRQLAH
ncbi:molybdopterin-dependent oxidoreductase [Marichromatium gracile]|uniref:Oxidoreductase molybdopterin-binding domain-containing protein n=1 Tax=Marichromatium gracile TaxID=1048 RepID=A0ABR5VF93_MARGR|nr:molybdopterin-dependent oxidoreductase [Marichromatium gracile]KXX64010.1 hypothetical protein AY586_15120 [Marichromatium gracile]